MCVLLRILVGKLAQSTTYKNEQLYKEHVSSFKKSKTGASEKL